MSRFARATLADGALARARERGARTGFLLCTYPTPALHQAHDVVIAPLVGPEVIIGGTAEELAATMKSDLAQTAQLIKDIGLQPE